MDIAETALQFINSTSGHIFLTGKAGTGKTTFLKNLRSKTHKHFVVVAPTGIAALNAGGVTIHSQFLFPLGTFLPDRSLPSDFKSDENCFTQNTLARKHPLNTDRKQVLRSIDLLVIDEVSMLRADMLDAIDYRLKSARGNFQQSFGGVQLLLIGDLYQLPPVVRRSEETILKRYYQSAWFYESLALKSDGYVYLELDKIFRQQGDTFIRILNNLRNNTPTPADIDVLNGHHRQQDEIDKVREVITLTTHNYKADEMNRLALKALEATPYFFEARIEGEFPESMYPVQSKLELKEGAQIMFTRNDSESQLYFNGKLATVDKIAGDKVEVILAESHTRFELRREIWENKRYTVNTDTKDLDEEVIGTFSQYPIKLAWAITVHKSQGLTFDKAIIDVEDAFTGGQVYVALSRLRSLDGLVLRTMINPAVIRTDQHIVTFSVTSNKPDELPATMKKKQAEFISWLIENTFYFEPLIKELRYATRSRKETVTLKEESMKPVLEQMATMLEAEKVNTEKFRRQLGGLLASEDRAGLLERVKKGSEYYKEFLWQSVKVLLEHTQEIKQQKKVKTYLNTLSELDQLLAKKLEAVEKAAMLIEGILQGHHQFDFSSLTKKRTSDRTLLLADIEKRLPSPAKRARAGKKGKKNAGGPSTYDITLKMWNDGMDIESIARERGLVTGTIEGHLAKAVQAGNIDIFKFVPEDDFAVIVKAIDEMHETFTSKDLFLKLDSRFSYPKLRAVMNYLNRS